MQPISPNDPHAAQELANVAAAAASVNSSDRERAELVIKQLQDSVDQQLGFVVLLLHLSSQGLPESPFCSIVLKNTIKLCWNPSKAEHCIQDQDKAQVRGQIVCTMLGASAAVQRNLAEAIALIAEVDFPMAWPDALQIITETLNTCSTAPLLGAALSTAHSVLARYRLQTEMSEEFVYQLRTVYSTFVAPLLKSMNTLLELANVGNADATTACRGLTAAVDCLMDMTALDVGDELIWGRETMVSLFLRCYALNPPHLMGSATLVELKSTVTSCVTHLLTAFDEDFEKDAAPILKVVWDLIADPSSAAPEMDDLVVCGIGLVSSACRGTTRDAFDNVEVLTNLIGQVITPNLALREEDVDTYNNEPEAFIQRDIEGSDLHTRRRAAGELVRDLVVSHPDKSKPLFLAELHRLFAEGATSWRSKDTAIYLASSLALEGQHVDAQRGVTQRLGTLIDFDAFLRETILPELTSPVSESSPPVVKADCLRVVGSFRAHIDPSLYPHLLGGLATWIASTDVVVMTYAAHTVERLLQVQTQGVYAVSAPLFTPHAPIILQQLCIQLQRSDTPNAYFAQCLWRICQRQSEAVVPFVADVVMCIGAVLERAAKNPSNPLFSHCIFEVLSKCIALQPHQGQAIEQTLWPHLIYILANDVMEYIPYSLQILSQLLSSYPQGNPSPPQQYQALLEPLTQPVLYEQRGNIPAVCCLLTTFIESYPSYVEEQGFTDKVLNISRYLVQLKNFDHEGLSLLTSILLSYPRETTSRFLSQVLNFLLQRMQTSKTPKFVRILIIFLSVMVIVRGVEDVVGRMNAIQPGLFFMVLDKIWLPNMQKITGADERKVCVVALARLLTESTALMSNPQAWASSVYSCLKMIHASVEQDDRTSFTPSSPTVQELKTESGGLSANVFFCPLQEAARRRRDVCADIHDPDRFFRDQMTALLRGSGASLVSVLEAALTPDLLALIQ